MSSLRPLMGRLDYDFKDPALLLRALTHSSYANENNATRNHGDERIKHSERLEFLGDSILNAATTTLLVERFPNLREGQLSSIRRRLVDAVTLADIGRQLELGALLRLSVGELKDGGGDKQGLLCDAAEAVVGAVFLDGGWPKAARVVHQWMRPRVESLAADPAQLSAKHPKNALQERTQLLRLGTPEYRNVEHPDAPENERWEVQVWLGQRRLASSRASRTKVASTAAAAAALAAIEETS